MKDHADTEYVASHPALAWLRFCHSGLTRHQQRELLDVFTTPQALYQAASTVPSTVRKRLSMAVDNDAIQRAWQWSRQADCHLVHYDHPQFPRLLKEIPDPPWLLYVKGDPGCLNKPCIAIVGSRNPSPDGSQNAREFASAFALNGWNIVSGLAMGIDGAAHRGALDAGSTTVAVTGTGADQVYPRRHSDLAARIARRGALVTEFPLGSPARRQHFPQRNRIISGLSRAVLVVEAGLRSGSLITARLAADQGREVCAVPGSIHMPTAHGCHQLIQQGAKLVECIGDVLEEIAAPAPAGMVRGGAVDNGSLADVPGQDRAGTGDYNPLQPHLGYEPVVVDELIQRSGLTAEAVSSMLLHMEVCGLVEALPGGYYQRIR